MFKDGNTVWVTTLGGNLTQWNTKTHECIHRIDVAALRGKSSSIRTCTRIQNLLWCGTGTVIIILDLETGKIKRRRRSVRPRHHTHTHRSHHPGPTPFIYQTSPIARV